MAKFIVYRTDAGVRVRAKVRKRFANGTVRVQPYFFQKAGKDLPGFIGGDFYIPRSHIVEDAA